MGLFTGTPAICGHRGCGRGQGENTLASCLAAVEHGVTWLEIDARQAAGGEVVLSHEPFEDGAGLTRLADLLTALPAHVGVDVEVKDGPEAAADLAAAAHAGGRPVVLTSFDPAHLEAARARRPGLPLGLVTRAGVAVPDAVARAAGLGVAVVAPHAQAFTPGREADELALARAARLEVVAWCPSPEEEARLAAAGVDCLVVDDVLRRSS